MSVLIILISISILVGGGFLVLFIWAVNTGQYEDTDSPSIRMLYNDTIEKNTARKSKVKNDKQGTNKKI